MAYDEVLANRVRAFLSARDDIVERKMFGGLAFMLGGNMCCGVVGEELMVRVGRDAYEESLSEPHAREMDFTGRPLKGMIYVSESGLRDNDSLREWIDRGARFAGSLPGK